MADLNRGIDRHRAVRMGTKSRRIDSESEPLKTGSSNAVTLDLERKMTWRSDFTLINFKIEGTYRNSKYYMPKDHIDPSRVPVEACRTDEEDLDELVIRYGPVVQILWINPTRKKKARKVFETFEPELTNDVQWSPRGSYLVSLDKKVTTLWGLFGRALSCPILMHFEHPMVNLVDFSPGEKYLVTYNRPDPPIKSELKIFDVETGRILMGGYDGVADVSWPVIRWAGGKDDSYFAMLSKNKTVSIYETQTFNVLNEMKYDDVVDMCWSPAESILALLKGCGKKISLVKIPEMVVLSEKDIDDDDVYDDYKMYWQSNGEYLAVILGPVIVLFRIKELGIPSEVLKVDKNILAFAWEPSGHRFAMIHGDQVVSFYSMQTRGKVSKLTSFNNKQADSIFWSPRGKHIVLAEFKISQFEFFDVDKLETMNKVQHLMGTTDIAWDPTGRYVVTASTISQEMEEGFKKGFEWVYPPPYPENGFFIWSFEGEKLLWKSAAKDYRLLQLDWRPYVGSIDEEMLKVWEKLDSDNSSSSEEECALPPVYPTTSEEQDSSSEEQDSA